jgi:hypothetical protein
MSQPVEIHLQEGFRGETVVIDIDDEVLARLAPSTRFQLGLAHIERADPTVGQSVRIALPELGLSAEHRLSADDRWLVVNRTGESLTIRSVSDAPGYV